MENSNEYAKRRLSLRFKDFVIIALQGYAKNEKENKYFREYFSIGGGLSWEDILKAVEDEDEIGLKILEQFRQMTEAELISRGVYSQQVEKKILWGQDVTNN